MVKRGRDIVELSNRPDIRDPITSRRVELARLRAPEPAAELDPQPS